MRGPTAGTVGPFRVAETVVLADLSVNVFFRHVNQLGSLIMRTNASGARTDVEQYTEHGAILQYPVAFDGQKSLISSVTSNSPEAGITNVHLTSGLLTSGALKGMTLVVSVLDIDSNTLRIGRVVDNDTDDIWVLDDDSIAGAIYHHSAIQNGFIVYKQQDANEVLLSGSWDAVFFANPDTDLIDTGIGSASAVGQWVSLPNGTWAEIIDIVDSDTIRVSGDRTEIVAASDPYVISKLPYTNLAYSTAGQWTAESFASGETTLTDSSATFNSYMVGWQIILDMEFPVAQVITAVPSATTLKVSGDVRTLTDPGKFYILFAPPKVNPANGTLADIVTAGEDDDWYDLTASSHFWAGYRYQPPMVGFYKPSNGTTVGAQAGNNKLGNYHCNNRIYSISHGRWLSPDQASSPAWNLFRYAGNNSVQKTDPTGLIDGWWDYFLEGDKHKKWKKDRDSELERLKKGKQQKSAEMLEELMKGAETDRADGDCCPKGCYEKIAKELSKFMAQAVEDIKAKYKQDTFGSAGNRKRDFARKARQIGGLGGPLAGELADALNPEAEWCDCIRWKERLTEKLKEFIDNKIPKGCECCKVESAAGFEKREGFEHHWLIVNIGKKSVPVDPWRTGYADGKPNSDGIPSIDDAMDDWKKKNPEPDYSD